MSEKEMICIKMCYTSNIGEETVVKKTVPIDWLNLSEMDIMHDIYKQFLSACGFVIDSSDSIVLQRSGIH